MPAADIREQVKDFKECYAHGDGIEECFAPWYLTKTYGVSATEAIRCSAESKQGPDGSGLDHGLDAFHLLRDDGKPPTLVLIQTKYSDSVKLIAQGARDFKKSLVWLKSALGSSEASPATDSKLLVNLRADLANLPPEERPKLKLEFVVVHLNEEDDALLNNKTRETQDVFKEDCRDVLPDAVFKLRLEGPRYIEHLPPPDLQPSPAKTIRFQGTSLPVAQSTQTNMFIGIGRLADLVAMFATRKEDLFSKNVRLFITSGRNVEKGPSARIKRTLRAICVDKPPIVDPETFALYHNGVTIHARDVVLSSGLLSFRDPYVLNGCQTIITAYRFRCPSNSTPKMDDALWDRITIPVRVINSRDEELIRTVTVNNNRQNAITAAALRANDPTQIALEQRFSDIEVFYERQEGAFEYVEESDPKRLGRAFLNSTWGPVNIEDLARCLAAAAGDITFARNTNDLFESDAAYNRCFSQTRTVSVHFLVFLQNLHNVLGVVLKNDLGLDWSTSYVKAGKVLYYALCLLCRYLAKNEVFGPLEDYGTSIVGRDRALRDEIAKQLDNYHSRIKSQIQERFMCLEDTKTESLNAAFEKAQKSLYLKDNVDVFEFVRNFDERLEERDRTMI
ncbi:MAG: hypothetical protein C5B50_05385 [Verrucomicrobia bacterium]|nr:MAG: hypothetical protein C5B50_05385 [Verrucomicrobiota bacterium]